MYNKSGDGRRSGKVLVRRRTVGTGKSSEKVTAEDAHCGSPDHHPVSGGSFTAWPSPVFVPLTSLCNGPFPETLTRRRKEW